MGWRRICEEGLLGLAFHPKYKENGRFYITFSRQGPKRLVLAEYTVSKSDPDFRDPASERVLLEIQEPEWNHNSGNLFFGPKDGMLTSAPATAKEKRSPPPRPEAHELVRQGPADRRRQPHREPALRHPRGQSLHRHPNAAPEIWAYGLRNPWGAAIDPGTGLFYLADVGQDLFEEINLIEKGGNYGWNYREAAHVFPAVLPS